jgi:hypothetical protein
MAETRYLEKRGGLKAFRQSSRAQLKQEEEKEHEAKNKPQKKTLLPHILLALPPRAWYVLLLCSSLLYPLTESFFSLALFFSSLFVSSLLCAQITPLATPAPHQCFTLFANFLAGPIKTNPRQESGWCVIY